MGKNLNNAEKQKTFIVRNTNLYLIAELSQGLGNQKLQLFGAILLAQMYKAALIEPEWSDWDYSDSKNRDKFESLYEFEAFAGHVSNEFGVQVLRRPSAFALTGSARTIKSRVIVKRPHQCWNVWLWYERQMVKRGILDDRLLGYLNAFKLSEQHQRVVNTILEKLNLHEGANTWHALHMRTEKDWFRHSKSIRREIDLTVEEEAYVSPKSIRNKFYSTFGLDRQHTLYLACDENSQYEDPFHIWSKNTRTLHKRDIVALANCNNNTKSAIDFELCVQSPVLIGSSRSSFLHLAALTRFARTLDRKNYPKSVSVSTSNEKPVFIYNLRASQLAKRKDHGFYVAAKDCVSEASLGSMEQGQLLRDFRSHERFTALTESCTTLVRRTFRALGLRRPCKAVLKWALRSNT